MKVEIKLSEGGTLPKKGEPNAMCYDCYALNVEKTDEGKISCDLGFSAKPPEGYGIRLIPRSNLTKHFWCMNNSIGIGDENYKGNYLAIFTPIPKPQGFHGGHFNTMFPYREGDRVCQMEIYKRDDFEFEIVETLSGELNLI